MELLLNLLWLMLAAIAFCKLWHDGGVRTHGPVGRSSAKAALAVTCMLVLLFPIVSASDDLHGDQALAEDAIKRIVHGVAPLQHIKYAGNTWILPSVLLLLSLLLLVLIPDWHPGTAASPMEGYGCIENGRAPPLLG